MTTSAVPSYAGYRFPAEVISHALWLPFRFPFSLRMELCWNLGDAVIRRRSVLA